MQGEARKEGITKNVEQSKENNLCRSTSEPRAPVPWPCPRKILVRQQRQRLVIVFPAHRQARQISGASERDTVPMVAEASSFLGHR